MSKQNTNTKKVNSKKFLKAKGSPDKSKKQTKVNQLQKYKKTPLPSYITQVPLQNALYETQVVVKPDWNFQTTQEMQAALVSYFLSKSTYAGEEGDAKLKALYDGSLYQWIGFIKEIGGQPDLTYRLRIVHDLINAFKQKDVNKYTFSKVSYGWEGLVEPKDLSYTTGWNTWQPVVLGQDSSSYDSPANIYVPTPTAAQYSAYMTNIKAISSNRAHYLTSVESEEPSPLSRDVSAYAKVYPYVGLNPSRSGGYYNDIENEVDIRAPILSHNVVYSTQIQDDRVPAKLNVNEGGPAASLAPLLQQYDSWFNKCHLNYKFLDIYDVINTLIYWYIEAAKQASADQGVPISVYQLPFSAQDFAILIRQHLMCQFKDQFIGQFVGPLAYDSGLTNFLPLQILGNCYGNDTFKSVLGPLLLAENLSMLQTVTVAQTTRKSKINKVTYVPVWGYYNDVQPDWYLPSPETPVPLFGVTGQKNISLVDCTINSNTYVNVNSAYYTYVQEMWNSKVTELKTFINVIDMANLSPPKNAAFLQATRVYGYVPQGVQEMAKAQKRLMFPALEPIKNLPPMLSIKDTDPKKRTVPPVSLPAPTNVQLITIETILMAYPPAKEIHELMTYLVLPCVRFDPNSPNDVLNKTMYQTITGEGISQTQNAQSSAPAYLNRQKNAADMAVEGKGKIVSSGLSIVLQKMMADGSGGFLSGLLGGIAKSILPGASGVIDTVSSALPF